MIRFLIVVLFVVSFLILSLPLLFILWIIGHVKPTIKTNVSYHIIQWAFSVVKTLSGVNLIVKGSDNLITDSAVLYIGNHRSFFDIILTYILCPGPTGYIAKKEMNKAPILRIWMRYIHCLFLDRNDIKQGLQTILEGISKIKSGISIFVFPEGTRNKTNDSFLPFKAGSLKIAEKTGCPIIPVAICNSAEVFENHLPKIYKTTVVIEFGTPIYPADLDKDAKKILSDSVRSNIIAMYETNKHLLN